jgi:hypothetical protein
MIWARQEAAERKGNQPQARNLNVALSIEAHMKVDHEIKVFQEHSGVAKWHNEWRGEYTDTEGGSYVTIFAGPQAEQRARDYHNALIVGGWTRSRERNVKFAGSGSRFGW